jgi:hypothetical protein
MLWHNIIKILSNVIVKDSFTNLKSLSPDIKHNISILLKNKELTYCLVFLWIEVSFSHHSIYILKSFSRIVSIFGIDISISRAFYCYFYFLNFLYSKKSNLRLIELLYSISQVVSWKDNLLTNRKLPVFSKKRFFCSIEYSSCII